MELVKGIPVKQVSKKILHLVEDGSVLGKQVSKKILRKRVLGKAGSGIQEIWSSKTHVRRCEVSRCESEVRCRRVKGPF